MEWISVEDRLPEPNNSYLACFDPEYGENDDRWVQEAHYYQFAEDSAPVWLDLDGDGGISYKVTHWMPLPKPPEK